MTAAVSLASSRDRYVLRSFARRIDPSDAGAHNNLGVLYYNKGLYAESVSAFMKALEIDQKMEVAQRNLEVAYFTSENDARKGEMAPDFADQMQDYGALWGEMTYTDLRDPILTS